MDPEKWGYHGWYFIHNIALGYDETFSYQKKQNYINFFNVISDVIPCEKCSKHYKEYILKNPPNIKNKDSLFKWTVDIHNNVNKILNKDQISYNKAYDIWLDKKINTKNTINNKFILNIILLFILILLITYSIKNLYYYK
tara:strand:+ start:214 stop:633 length:420 start_codon:yes stop_codon:yes gene_type:complete